MKRCYVDLPEYQVHYRTEGDGEVLLLLHQTPSSSAEYTLAMRYLAESYCVIAMDTLGHGMSDPPLKEFTIPDYARSVKDFLTAIGVNKANVLGHHTGASIALCIAAEYPEIIKNLILSGCPYYECEDRKKKLYSVDQSPRLENDGQQVLKLWNGFKYFNPGASPEELICLLIAGLMAGSQGESAHRAVFEYKEQEDMPRVKCPTLLISGTEDIFLQHMDATCKLIPQCTPKTIEGGGSAIALTRPKEFADTVLEFLR